MMRDLQNGLSLHRFRRKRNASEQCFFIRRPCFGADGGLSIEGDPLSPVTYTINFDTTAGLTPDSGDFTYNPGSSTFSNFAIHWDGAAFDFTSQANSGIGGNSCGDPTNDPAARFALLAQTLNCGSHTSGGFLFSTNDGGLSA